MHTAPACCPLQTFLPTFTHLYADDPGLPDDLKCCLGGSPGTHTDSRCKHDHACRGAAQRSTQWCQSHQQTFQAPPHQTHPCDPSVVAIHPHQQNMRPACQTLHHCRHPSDTWVCRPWTPQHNLRTSLLTESHNHPEGQHSSLPQVRHHLCLGGRLGHISRIQHLASQH